MFNSQYLWISGPYETFVTAVGKISGPFKTRNQTQLVRGIGRWGLASVVFNSIIGASVFGLPAATFKLVNTYSVFALVACSLLVGLIILCFAEVSSRFTAAGGAYQYAQAAFNPLIGFEVGWLTWFTRVMGFAAVCNLFVTYLGHFSFFNAAAPLSRATTIVVLVASLTFINLAGVQESAATSVILAIGKLALFLTFIIVGVFYVNWQNISFGPMPSQTQFSSAVVLLIFSFGGFEGAVIVAGEVNDPRRNYPFALLTVAAIVALIYVLIQLVCIGTLPNLAQHDRPLADAAGSFLGVTGATVISIGALVSIYGTLHAGLLGLTRMPFAVAGQGLLPRILAATHPRFKTPYVSILISSAVILILGLSNSFISALKIAVMTRLIVYVITCAALPVLRRSDAKPAAFVVPAGIVVSISSLALCAWLLTSSTWREMRDTAISAAVGLMLYVLFNLKRKSAPS